MITPETAMKHDRARAQLCQVLEAEKSANALRKLEPGVLAREASAASLAEDIYLRIICEPAFEKWTLSSRAEFAKRAARIFYGIEK